MKFLINKKKSLNLRRIYLLIYFLGYIETAFSGGSSGGSNKLESIVAPVPVVLDANDFHAISAYCLDQHGKVENISETFPSKSGYTPTFDSGITRYLSYKFYRDPNTDLARDNNMIFNYCKNQNQEVDIDHMYLMEPKKFGENINKQKTNFDFLQNQKKFYKGNLYIPLNVLDSRGAPQRFQDDSRKYILLGLDDYGIMSGETLQKISSIRLENRPLAIDTMISKAQDVSASGNKVDIAKLETQLKGVQELGDFYANNINLAKNALSGLKEYSYISLSETVKKLIDYFQNAEIGNANTEDAKLNNMLSLYSTTLNTLATIKLKKDKIRTVFNSINEIAKNLPGEEPRDLNELVNSPKKYTIPFRLISDSVSEDSGLVKLFYTFETWEEDLKKLEGKITQLKSVKAGFIKNITTKISALQGSVDKDYPKKKRDFEKGLNNVITQGEVTVFNTIIDPLYQALEKESKEINAEYSNIFQSIEGVNNIQDEIFQNTLTQIKTTLNTIAQKIQTIAAYQETLPSTIQDSYSKILSQKVEIFNALQVDVNDNITKISDLTKATTEAIGKDDDAAPSWESNVTSINSLINNLVQDKEKLGILLAQTKEQDLNLKTSIVTLNSRIDFTLQDITTIKNYVVLNQLKPYYFATINLIIKMTDKFEAPDSFPEALRVYHIEKDQTALVAKYQKISSIKDTLKASLKGYYSLLADIKAANPENAEIIVYKNRIESLIADQGEYCLDTLFDKNIKENMPVNILS
ncbi:hypothetical protein [Holospora undulata]|uniref:Uncharacterized protein n=1 Tax=Holospora undulata HU1 TaxID=1321371 RepID=A0A061JH49_9PROT|nr:hypothetical protein [Holospora undulata]ETZ05506.1 hypothetical protein K737_300053 [Holospora undulata HU1]